MKTIFALILFLTSNITSACLGLPDDMIIKEVSDYYSQADLVFFGEIVSFDDLQEYNQNVVFKVKKIYKGPEFKTILVINKLGSSCAQVFFNKGSSYYVYAKKSRDEESYYTNGNFVSEKKALQENFMIESTHNKSLNQEVP